MKRVFYFFLIIMMLFATSSCCNIGNYEYLKGEPRVAEPMPTTNGEIRQWYNDRVSMIPGLNNRWMEQGVSAKERAERAYEIRHFARIQARWMMQSIEEVDLLKARDMKKYGDPSGPTFDYLVEKNRKKGLQGDDVYESIINSSATTNSKYNKKFGIKKSE